ncbi:MAG: NAD-dependent epimerase/dehydratase family protein [Chloroflexaceae bacterium]|nr:NAD-dependent epimerase/dehydratase family protein [Chloroflexaceae bacterium]
MSQTILITGGCGFIGSNLVAFFLRQGFRVRVLDSLARPGSEVNHLWLHSLGYDEELTIIRSDIRDAAAVESAVHGVDGIFHAAGQVAVTHSVLHPREDFEINALGTINVLEAARRQRKPPLVVLTSTNKVYGATRHVPIVEQETRYMYGDERPGISEEQPLDFHSPYGCSKGSADQYVLDYARIYGIPTVVLRMSCIYGPRQFGNEDQGWVAHFVISALKRNPITIFGDGKQVRDVLFIDDLINMFWTVWQQHEHVAGEAFNIGGGPEHTLSIWREFGPLIERISGQQPAVAYGDWRPGDQRVYISDIRKAHERLGWSPQIGVEEGVARLYNWLLREHPQLSQMDNA